MHPGVRRVGALALSGSLILLGVLLGVDMNEESATAAEPTVEEAREFVDRAEAALLELWIKDERAAWVQANFITEDTEVMAAEASRETIASTMEFASEATRFDGLDLPYDVARRLNMLKLATSLPAPSDPALQKELTLTMASMKSRYGKGEYCPGEGKDACLELSDLSRILAESRDPDRLLEAWRGWRNVSPPMRSQYERFVELANRGARDLGFPDLGAMWRSNYDMSPDAFASDVERLWQSVKPFYEQLHAHVRGRLGEKYGTELVPESGPIPAHLLGNMWSQSWGNIYSLVRPEDDDPGYDLTSLLRSKKVSELDMVRYGEGFFTSLGFSALPPTFWERSLFVKPADRDVVCHASAWDIDFISDLRIKMCIEINEEDFITIHHELGHNYYQYAYRNLPGLYRDSANDGFHEGLGDTLALSITPEYLVQVGLLDRVPPEGGDIGYLMRMALEKVAFLPFGLLIDQWRWKVYSGEILPSDYNASWWELRTNYQGIVPPVERSEADFDPGAKYHIPANVPYTRYFLATFLQFQFHRALARESGWEGPLHRFSVYGNKEAGKKLKTMLEMGKSRPWPDALEALTGQREVDPSAMIEYFEPLLKWLKEQNQGRQVGF